MELLVDLFGYLSIIVHGLTIVSQSMALGGVLFLVLLARPLGARLDRFDIPVDVARIAGYAALAMAACEVATVALQAAVLSAKLPHLAAWSAKRRSNAAYYFKALCDVPGITVPFIEPQNESIFNQYTIRADRRDDLQRFLKERGIGTAVYYPLPLHLQPCFAYLGYKEGTCPEAELAAREVLSLPIYPELTESQLNEVIEAVRAFYVR